MADLSVDLNLPTLVAAVAAGLKLSAETLRRVRRALDRKDEGGIAKAVGEGKADAKKAADMLVGLLRAAGPAEPGMARLTALKLPAAAAAEAARLAEVVKLVRAADEDLLMTLDPVEYRGLEYQTGVSFSVFDLTTWMRSCRRPTRRPGGRDSSCRPERRGARPPPGRPKAMPWCAA